MGTRALIVVLLARGTLLPGLASHAEWVEKTTLDGANWEIFWFD
jgi:hypothetical protein